MENYYLKQFDGVVGPYTLPTLMELSRSGKIDAYAEVSRASLGDQYGWEMLSDVICRSGLNVNAPSYFKKEDKKSDQSRVAYVLLGLFLGGFGVHNFYIGRVGVAVCQLLLWFVTIGLIVAGSGLSVLPMGLLGVWILIDVFTIKYDSDGGRLS